MKKLFSGSRSKKIQLPCILEWRQQIFRLLFLKLKLKIDGYNKVALIQKMHGFSSNQELYCQF